MSALNRYIGIPWQDAGRSWSGVDCWGLVVLHHRTEYGIAVAEHLGEYEQAHQTGDTVRVHQQEMGSGLWLPVEAPVAGDVVLLGVPSRAGLVPVHVGLVERPGAMLHAERGCDVARETYTGGRWGRRVLGIYRHKERM